MITATATVVSTPQLEVSVAEAGAGEHLVYLHDVLFDVVDASEELPAIVRLLASERHVIAPTLPGFRNLGDLESVSDVEDYALLLADLLAALDVGTPHLVGTGLGGWLAAEVATRYPSLIRSLTLVNAFGLRLESHPIGRFFEAAAPNPLGGRREVRELLFADPDGEPAQGAMPDFPTDEANERFFRHVHAASRIGWTPPAFYNPKLLGRLSRVTVPTLVVWGSANRLVGDAHRASYSESIPGATSVTIGDAGHAVVVERPDELAAAISGFLAGVES